MKPPKKLKPVKPISKEAALKEFNALGSYKPRRDMWSNDAVNAQFRTENPQPAVAPRTDTQQAIEAGLYSDNVLRSELNPDMRMPTAADLVRPKAPETRAEKFARNATEVAPYVSNFINAFRRAPEPKFPKMTRPVTFSKVNFDADRAEIDRQISGMNQNLNMLGENQATAARTGNMIQGLRAKNQLAQAEQNANAQISNSAAAVNSQLDTQNVMMENQYRDAQVNQDMVNMTQQSANVANAADKFVASRNQKDLMKLEGTKYKILSEIYKDSGVLERLTSDFREDPKTGVPMKRFGGDMKFTAGGMRRVFGDGGQMADPPGLTRGLIPKPSYRFSASTTNPNMFDSADYRASFDQMYRKTPEAAYRFKSMREHPTYMNSSTAVKELDPKYKQLRNMELAFDDAQVARIMSDSEVYSELHRPVVLPPDTKKKAFGGLLDEPKPVGPANTYSRATNKHTNMAGHAFSQTLEADRARDALVLSPQGTQLAATQLNIAPQQAQTAEALRSGDYFAPPQPNYQHVSIKVPLRTAPSYVANTIKKFQTGGKLRKVYN